MHLLLSTTCPPLSSTWGNQHFACFSFYGDSHLALVGIKFLYSVWQTKKCKNDWHQSFLDVIWMQHSFSGMQMLLGVHWLNVYNTFFIF